MHAADYLPTVYWVLTLVLMMVGLVGTVVPLLPGTTIILAAAILHRFLLGEAHSIGWWTLGGLVVLVLLSYGVELMSGSVGAKKFGATRWGAIGGLVGTIGGMFFGIPGIFVGPVVGVLAGELLGGRGLLPAGKSTWGTFLGTTAGMISNLIIGSIMIGWFLLVAVWH